LEGESSINTSFQVFDSKWNESDLAGGGKRRRTLQREGKGRGFLYRKGKKDSAIRPGRGPEQGGKGAGTTCAPQGREERGKMREVQARNQEGWRSDSLKKRRSGWVRGGGSTNTTSLRDG